MKKALILLGSAAGILLIVLAQIGYVTARHFNTLSDIRTSLLRQDGLAPEAVERGRELLARAVAAQGGMERWKQLETADMLMRDEWADTFMGRQLNPWPGNDLSVRFQNIVGTFNYRIEILEGPKKGEIWGNQSWHIYRQPPGGQADFSDFEHAGLTHNLLAAIDYFFELPFRLSRAPIVTYAGTRTLHGQEYDLVFVTWEKPEPHAEHDQYLLFIHPETGLAEYALWTFRNAMLSYVGSIQYRDFREVDGMGMPHELILLTDIEGPPEKYYHRVRLSEMTFNTIPRESLLPDPSIPYMGDDKIATK